jgi:hypothetical protein
VVWGSVEVFSNTAFVLFETGDTTDIKKQPVILLTLKIGKTTLSKR